MFMVGYMLSEGVGTERDEKGAASWFRRSAEAGVPEAQFKYARLIEEGKAEGTVKDAFDWYTKAAEVGFGPAKFNLGTMYYEGNSVKQDFEKAFQLYDDVASEEDADGLFMTARMLYEGLGVGQDQEEAMKRFGRSANAGSKLAQEFLEDLRRKQNTQFIKIDGL
jgi:hypothetical protein